MASTTWRGAARGDRFGTVVAGVGDVNGDGFDDVGIGAPGADGLGSDAGAVYVFYGPQIAAGSAVAADRTLLGATAGDAAGSSLVRLGDVDGDLDADFAVGAPLAGSLGNDGAVYIITEGVGTLVLSDAAATLRGAGGERAGSSLASARSRYSLPSPVGKRARSLPSTPSPTRARASQGPAPSLCAHEHR